MADENAKNGSEAPAQEQQPEFPGISAVIRREVPGIPFTANETRTDVNITVDAENLLDLVSALKQNKKLAFDFLGNIAGVDFEEEGMAVKYHLYSFTHRHSVQITVPTPPGRPHIPSLTSLYKAADWHERETSEMFGFIFDGHPYLRNLLLEEDLVIHPLLKAHPLQPIEVKQGTDEEKVGFDI